MLKVLKLNEAGESEIGGLNFESPDSKKLECC